MLRGLFKLCCISLTLLLAAACTPQQTLNPLAEGDVILTFGDSLTYGTGATQAESYPNVLASLTGHEVIRSGVPGEVSALGLRRLPTLLDRHQPALLILCHGGNDILRRHDRKQMRENLIAMIELARSRGTQVLLLGVPDFGFFLSVAEDYVAVAEQTDTPILDDILPDILSDSALKADQIHPNAAGYRRMAEEIRSGLIELGAI